MTHPALAVSPLNFVEMHYLNKRYWGIEVPQEPGNMLSFSRYVISAKLFKIDELKQIQRAAILQDASDDIRHWIYNAIVERSRFILNDVHSFYWVNEGGLAVNTYANDEKGIVGKVITADTHQLSELDNLSEIADKQKEPVVVGNFIRRVAEQLLNKRTRGR